MYKNMGNPEGLFARSAILAVAAGLRLNDLLNAPPPSPASTIVQMGERLIGSASRTKTREKG